MEGGRGLKGNGARQGEIDGLALFVLGCSIRCCKTNLSHCAKSLAALASSLGVRLASLSLARSASAADGLEHSRARLAMEGAHSVSCAPD